MWIDKTDKKEQEFKKAKLIIGEKLARYREQIGYDNPQAVARELSLALDTIYKIEKGGHIPTKRTLTSLITIYRLTPKEAKELTIECENARKIRSEIVSLSRGE